MPGEEGDRIGTLVGRIIKKGLVVKLLVDFGGGTNELPQIEAFYPWDVRPRP